MNFFIEVLAGGLLAGVMYSLVALGFVLIYKASGVFNYAQGSLVFVAALTFVSLLERNVNFWLALAITLVVMVVVAVVSERVVLRPLVNQPPITLFMATIGLSFVLEGLSQMTWGAQPHGLELGIPDVPIEWLSQKANINISQLDLFAALVAGVLVAAAVVATSLLTMARFLLRVNAWAAANGVDGQQLEEGIRQGVVRPVVGGSWSLLLFVLFVGAGVYFRRRSASHKRCMLLASLAILGPVFAASRPIGRLLAPALPPHS